MYICKNCGASYAEHVTFCAQCGSNLMMFQQDTPPAYNPYGTTAPSSTSYYAAPVPASENKVPAILSLVFGSIAVLISFYLMIFLAELASYPFAYYASDSALGAFFGCGIFIIPGAILGLVMSGKTNALKGMSIAGKITSIVALALLGISFFIMIGICA